MSRFSDRPFVAGSLNGVRAFSVDRLGRLTGVCYHTAWKPGENVATCAQTAGDASYRYDVGGLIMSSRIPIHGLPTVPAAPHHVAIKNCSCGFHAYFDGTNDYAGEDSITGVIEGYGHVTVGAKGLRCEKAKIVALVVPRRRRAPSLARWWQTAMWALASLVSLVGLLFARAGSHRLFAGALLVVDVGLAVWFGRRAHRPGRSERPRVDFERVRDNYPDVPTYPTLKAALAEHSVAHPNPPQSITPETCDDFWTRPA